MVRALQFCHFLTISCRFCLQFGVVLAWIATLRLDLRSRSGSVISTRLTGNKFGITKERPSRSFLVYAFLIWGSHCIRAFLIDCYSWRN
ncbi:hypothetical protein Pyn_29966 [Prunus yedoensis var. nudiflora]|uniref:Uncharacterized protein n=1 Tax=Prunus yedoensis var. nudiflora TaxID=2094558 RepID=A0A314YV31_PRUYE|nr:hypothetical protein Pyn_29966 [Prunus yedoensis var. nudiflora]